jgi:hypothetical protein
MADSASLTTPEAGDEKTGEDLGDLPMEALLGDSSTMGNQSAREALRSVAERQISQEAFEAVKERALALGMVRMGRGRAIGLEEGIPRGRSYEAPSAPTNT